MSACRRKYSGVGIAGRLYHGSGDIGVPVPKLELVLRPLFGPLREALVIGSDPKHRLLGFLIVYVIGKAAHLFGAFAPMLGIVDVRRHLIALSGRALPRRRKYRQCALEYICRLIRANFPSGFLEPLGLALILDLRLSLLLFACFSHTASQI